MHCAKVSAGLKPAPRWVNARCRGCCAKVSAGLKPAPRSVQAQRRVCCASVSAGLKPAPRWVKAGSRCGGGGGVTPPHLPAVSRSTLLRLALALALWRILAALFFLVKRRPAAVLAGPYPLWSSWRAPRAPWGRAGASGAAAKGGGGPALPGCSFTPVLARAGPVPRGDPSWAVPAVVLAWPRRRVAARRPARKALGRRAPPRVGPRAARVPRRRLRVLAGPPAAVRALQRLLAAAGLVGAVLAPARFGWLPHLRPPRRPISPAIALQAAGLVVGFTAAPGCCLRGRRAYGRLRGALPPATPRVHSEGRVTSVAARARGRLRQPRCPLRGPLAAAAVLADPVRPSPAQAAAEVLVVCRRILFFWPCGVNCALGALPFRTCLTRCAIHHGQKKRDHSFFTWEFY